MDHIPPGIVADLGSIAASQDLENQALEGCGKWMETYRREESDSELHHHEVVMELDRIALVFRHGVLDYPFVETRIGLYVKTEDESVFRGLRPVGTYRLITLLDGTVDDDYFVIERSEQT